MENNNNSQENKSNPSPSTPQPISNGPSSSQDSSKKKKGKGCLIAVIVVVVIGLVLAAVLGLKVYDVYQTSLKHQAYVNNIQKLMDTCKLNANKLSDHAKLLEANPNSFNDEWKANSKKIVAELSNSCGSLAQKEVPVAYQDVNTELVKSDTAFKSAFEDYSKALDAADITQIEAANKKINDAMLLFSSAINKLNETTEKINQQPF